MLILTRKVGEEITIGDDIKVTIVSIQGKVAKIGIEAPTDIPIMRSNYSTTKEERNGFKRDDQ